MFDIEIEKAVLYFWIFENQNLDLNESDFVDIKNKEIARVILELKKSKEEISPLTIQNKIRGDKNKALEYITNLNSTIWGTSEEKCYKKLKEYSKKRMLKQEVEEISKEIKEIEDIDTYTERKIKELQEIAKIGILEKESMLDRVVKTMSVIEQNYKSKDDYSLYTGFFDLDNLTSGLHKKEFTVIGARPAVGKTTFALQVAMRIAERGTEVAFFSLEMSDTQIITKMISKQTGINNNKMKFGTLEQQDFDKISETSSKLSELPFEIITDCFNIQEIELEIRRLKNRKDIGLVVIDYLQLIKNNNKKYTNREQELADISRTLKLLSLELDIPIIALCQLNRNAARTEPTLADIRESGAIEQDADNVIFLYKQNEEKQEDVQDIIVDLQKQRNGNTGTVILRFVKALSEFRNLER